MKFYSHQVAGLPYTLETNGLMPGAAGNLAGVAQLAEVVLAPFLTWIGRIAYNPAVKRFAPVRWISLTNWLGPRGRSSVWAHGRDH